MRVILAAGGSGGHIFPAASLALELEKKGNIDIFLIASKRELDQSILKDSKFPSFFLSVNPMPHSFNASRFLAFLVKLVFDTVRSILLIVKIRPHAVVGFGGYTSGAIVISARIFGVPIILHEQNLIPGRANRLLSIFSKRIAISFKETINYFSYRTRKRIVYTGSPLRTHVFYNDRLEAARRLSLTPDKQTILVMGGSQGASFLNSTSSKAIGDIAKEKGDRVQFIHLTGKKDYTQVAKFYIDNKIPCKTFSFLDDIGDAYALSDVVISRSGAISIFELAFYSKAMILVPYPSYKNDQRFNAMYLAKAGAAIYREEKDLSAGKLAGDILDLLNDSGKRLALAQKAHGFSMPNAAELLAKEVIELAHA